MKPSFLKKLNVRVNLLPSLLICIILVAFAFGFYYYIHNVWLYKHLNPHIKEQTHKSQRSIDDFVKSLKDGVLTFSQDDLLINTILTLTKPADFSHLPPKKKVVALKAHEHAKQEALTSLKHLTTKTAQSLRLQSLQILSNDNQTISSVNTHKFNDNLSSTAPLQVIFDNTSAYLIITTGIKTNDNTTVAFIRAIANITDIKSYLELSPRYYQSEKLELIDSNAIILLHKDGVLKTGLRYNLSNLDGLTEQIHTRADVIFMVYPIKTLKLFVIYTVNVSDVVSDWMDVFYVYCAVAVAVMMLLLLQVAVNFPKFVSKPLAELTKSIKTATSNQVEIPQKLNPEWLALANAINKLLAEIATAKPDLSTSPEDLSTSPEAKPQDDTTIMKEVMTVAPIETPLDTQDSSQSKEATPNESPTGILFEDFFKALKQRAEKINRKDSVAVVFDCSPTLASKTVPLNTDKALEALDIILNHSISDMQEGVVTVLASENDAQNLVIEVIDTSAGYDSEVVEAFSSDRDYTGLVDIAQAKKILQSIGANLQLSSTKSKGSSYSATFNLNNS